LVRLESLANNSADSRGIVDPVGIQCGWEAAVGGYCGLHGLSIGCLNIEKEPERGNNEANKLARMRGFRRRVRVFSIIPTKEVVIRFKSLTV